MTAQPQGFTQYKLNDRYDLEEGRVFLTGTQALVRIMLEQTRRDRAAGNKTAGFVSGYRGSPWAVWIWSCGAREKRLKRMTSPSCPP